MKFLYFYERHVFAYDIFEIQFGTCSIVFMAQKKKKLFLCRFLLIFCFEIPMAFFLFSFLRLPQLVFISLLAALNKKKQNYNENIRQSLSGIQRAFKSTIIHVNNNHNL